MALINPLPERSLKGLTIDLMTIDLQTANVGKKPMDYVPFWASEYDNFTVSCKAKKPEVSYEGFSAGLDSHHNTL
jgi:hypothetical protein